MAGYEGKVSMLFGVIGINDLKEMIPAGFKLTQNASVGAHRMVTGQTGHGRIASFLHVVQRLLSQLDSRIESYERLNSGERVAKGVLIANAWRGDPPGARGLPEKLVFAEDTVEHAQLLKFALLDTRVLYHIVCDKMEGKLDDAAQVLIGLRDTVGIYSYP